MELLNLPNKKVKYATLEITDYITVQQEADESSNKIFWLKSKHLSNLWKLPPSTGIYSYSTWVDADLSKLKAELNGVKSLLEVYDLETWHSHTNKVNYAANIPVMLRSRAKPEFLTKAFLKCYEILHKFEIIPAYVTEESAFTTLHLCEAPGAFIVALNHFLVLKRADLKEKWKWLANTLNPYYEGTPTWESIVDDRFIIHTLPHWFFGKDQTGNLLSVNYLEELENLFQDKRVHVVTADGSIDCQGNPGEQEAMTFHLQFCEVFAALSVLAEGGSLILKRFTAFEADSVNLLYFICCCFEEVAVHKPITSKAGNSEVYIIALKYKCTSLIDDCLKEMRQYYAHLPGTMMFSQEQIPVTFLSNIKECCRFFQSFQIRAIKFNVELYERPSEKNSEYLDLLKRTMVQIFCDNNQCDPIDASMRLVPKEKLQWNSPLFKNDTIVCREDITKKVKSERLKILDSRFRIIVDEHLHFSKSDDNSGDFIIEKIVINCDDEYNFNCVTGKPFNTVYSSCFCHTGILGLWTYCCKEFFSDEALICDVQKRDCRNSDIEKLMDTIKSEKIFQNAKVFYNRPSFQPNTDCFALQQILKLMGENTLQLGDSVILCTIFLLTRLQSALFYTVASAFSTVSFCSLSSEQSFLDFPPFILLENFASQEKGKKIYEKLVQSGYEELERGFHEIMSLPTLIGNPLYPYICKYNAHFCLWNINKIRNQVIKKD